MLSQLIVLNIYCLKVIRMSFRQLTPEEEKYEENVWAAWEAFLLQMQDASEFVNTQTPLMTQLLEDTYQVRIMSGTLLHTSHKSHFLDLCTKYHQDVCLVVMHYR